MNQASISVSDEHRGSVFGPDRPLRLAYFVNKPIQYQAPLLRRIAQEPDIDLRVFFASDHSIRGYHDPGFGVRVEWDVPLLDGYRYEFLPSIRQTDRIRFARPLNWGIASRLRRGRFDAVWLFGYNLLYQINTLLAARMLGIPVLLRAEPHLNDRPRSAAKLLAKQVLVRSLRSFVSCALPIGQLNRGYWAHYLGEDFPMSPMPYAVDNEFFRRRAVEAAPRREELRRELGLEAGRPIVLYASKLQTRKRCIDLVEAWIRLAPAPGVDPPGYLLIVGDGEERAALEERVRQSGFSSIRFLGFKNQTELPRYFDLCDVFVLPSIQEPWGLIVNEVMNAGRPVVVSDQVGCQPDLVHSGLNGFVYPAFDVAALSDCLRRLMDDPGLRATMGENALRVIAQQSFEEDVAGLRRALSITVPDFPEAPCP
jgi:glycosyltransferase involved in cell wall biosynthesis